MVRTLRVLVLVVIVDGLDTSRKELVAILHGNVHDTVAFVNFDHS
jgi:hypothetical protein